MKIKALNLISLYMDNPVKIMREIMRRETKKT